MGVIELTLVIAGVILCIASFIIPEKKEKLNENTKKIARDELKSMVAEEMSVVQKKIDGVVDETVEYAIEKAERTMERVSNEKIMAVHEYSDTVLEDIHKNHQEVIFMYDMLNDKQEKLKTVVQESDKTLRTLMSQIKETESDLSKEILIQDNIETNKQKDLISANTVNLSMSTDEANELLAKIEKESEEKKITKTKTKSVEKKNRGGTRKVVEESEKTSAKTEENSDKKEENIIELQLSGNKKEENISNNEKILQLHKAGKSNMAIARELGLGMGEVRLVIDLYEGTEDKL